MVNEIMEEWIMAQEFEELYQRFEEASEILEGNNVYKGEVIRVTSASFAQYLIEKLNKVCICTGLNHITMKKFWIFVMTGSDAFDAFQEFDYSRLEGEKDEDQLNLDDEKLPHQISSASMAVHIVLNLRIPCICRGLNERTMEPFWLFLMTKTEANEALVKYNGDYCEFEDCF